MMIQATESRPSRPVGDSEVLAYLLGLGRYAYRDGYRYAEQYHRLHQVIGAVAHSSSLDGESTVLRLGAQLAQIDRVLAALLVDGARERLDAGSGWDAISEDTYFRLAREHGKLIDYIRFDCQFTVPATVEACNPLARHILFAEHFLALPEGPARHGLRLGLLTLFDGEADDVAVALAVCDRLRGRDATLDALAGDRLSLAMERAEILRYDAAYHDLAAQMVSATGRWRVVDALPHLQRLLARTPARDRASRVLRALLLRAVDQLS